MFAVAPGLQPFSLGGIRIDAITRPELVELLADSIASKQRATILHHNLHSLHLYETMSDVRSFYDSADCVYIDGMPVVWLCKAAGLDVHSDHRITLLDSFEEIIDVAAQRGWRVFYLGGTQEVLEAGLTRLRERFPSLNMQGRNGFFRKEGMNDAQVVAEINRFRPDILLVGMGMPLQERWLAANQASLTVPAILTCGTTLSYVTGHSFRPPAWASKLGLYGVMRLFSEPRRLWQRYLVEPLLIMRRLGPAILRQRLRKDR